MTKMSDLIKGECRAKLYTDEKSLNQASETFRTRMHILEGLKGNFKNSYLCERAKCEGCNHVLHAQGH